MKLKAGTLTENVLPEGAEFPVPKEEEWNNSMAKAMDEALEKEWLALEGTPLPEEGKVHRQMLLAAICQGILRHLKDAAEESFVVEDVGTKQITSGAPDARRITSTGTVRIGNSSWPVQVTQDQGSLVVTRGKGKNVKVSTEGVLHE